MNIAYPNTVHRIPEDRQHPSSHADLEPRPANRVAGCNQVNDSNLVGATHFFARDDLAAKDAVVARNQFALAINYLRVSPLRGAWRLRVAFKQR